jgi:hypothetical protein
MNSSIGSKPSASARMVAIAASTMGGQVSPAASRAASTKGRLRAIGGSGVAGNILDTMSTVKGGMAGWSAGAPGRRKAAAVRAPTTPSGSRPWLC